METAEEKADVLSNTSVGVRAASSDSTVSSIRSSTSSRDILGPGSSGVGGGFGGLSWAVLSGLVIGLAASAARKGKTNSSREGRRKNNRGSQVRYSGEGERGRERVVKVANESGSKRRGLGSKEGDAESTRSMEEIERLYAGLEKMARDNRVLQTKLQVKLQESNERERASEPQDEQLKQTLANVEDEQRQCRILLKRMESDIQELAEGRREQQETLDEHIVNTSAGFQDAIEALSIMKEKISDFEAKVSELGNWNGAAADITGKLDEVKKEQDLYLQVSNTQAVKMGEISQRLEVVSKESSSLSQDIADLRKSSQETKALVRENRELSKSLKDEFDSFDLQEMQGQIENAVKSTSEGLDALSSMSLQVAGYDSESSETKKNPIEPIEVELNEMRQALSGTQESMRKLEEELSGVAESMAAMQQTNKFSLFLHKFYLSLHKHLEENALTLQQVFSQYDGNKDGALSGEELTGMLKDLVPDSQEEDRKSLVFFLDPMNEGMIHYGKVLQNASNVLKSGSHSVKFQIKYFTRPNQHLRVVGSHEDLGWWRSADAPRMYEVEHGTWEASVSLPGQVVYEYKYVVCKDTHAIEWLPGSNLVLELPPGPPPNLNGNGNGVPKDILVEDKWNSHPATEPLDSTVKTRSNIIRMLSAAGEF